MRAAVRVPGHEAAVSNQEKPVALTPPSGRLFFLAREQILDLLGLWLGLRPRVLHLRLRASAGGAGARGLPGYSGAVVRKVLLASPRGYCAGVERAVETVEKALDLYGAPVYVRKQIVHNLHVVRDLEARGAVFVDEETEVPEGETVVFSAHGVAPSVHSNAATRRLNTIDATCPLVTKVHVQARRYAADGFTVILIGHAGHEEVVGTMGEAPESIVLVESVADVEALDFAPGSRLAYV